MIARLRALWRNLIQSRTLDFDIEAEMRFHIEQQRDDLMRAGVDPSEAARRARIAFGDINTMKEAGREVKGVALFDEFWRNSGYALRQLRRAPAFAAAVILTLGLCIGVNTVVFSVIDAALLRALPYHEPDRLGEVAREVRKGSQFYRSMRHTGKAWEALKDASSVQVAAIGSVGGVNLTFGSHPMYVQQQRVGSGYLQVLGEPLAMGREFTKEEDRPGGPPVAVLSHSLWKRAFGGDMSILGRPIQLRGETFTVVGVTQESFRSQRMADVWTPLRPSVTGEGSGSNYTLIARLNSGVNWAQAQAEITSRGAAAFAETLPDGVSAVMQLQPFNQDQQTSLKKRLAILSAAVLAVLLIGCVNIASLMLARGANRRRELGTRIALGGGPGSLARQLATESLVLGLCGGLAGVLMGSLAIGAARDLVVRYGVWQELTLDARVLLASIVLSLGVSFLFGVAPMLQAARVDVRDALLEGARGSVGGHALWVRRVLVFAEVALSLVLFVGAGLLARTVWHLEHLEPGFDARNVLSASASLYDARYAQSQDVNRLYRETLAAIRRIPGVESAAVGLHTPYERWLNNNPRLRAPRQADSDIGTAVNYVSPGYVETLKIALRQGRTFTDADTETSAPVAIVNETFVKRFIKNGDALNATLPETRGVQRAIVGVVTDVQSQPGLSYTGPIVHEPAIYYPSTQFGAFTMAHTWFSPNWIVRAAGRRADIQRNIEKAIASVDPLLPVASFESMVEKRGAAIASQRINAMLLATIAGLAMLLAMVGVYGIVSNSVVERTREFGIRQALGSGASRVIWNAIAPAFTLTILGVGAGGVLAAAGARILDTLLVGVQPLDPATFAAAALVLIVVSVASSLWPALRVTRLSLAEVLRGD